MPNRKPNLSDAASAATRGTDGTQRTEWIYGPRAGTSFLAPWPTQPCKVVFLDFDGVLKNAGSMAERGTSYEFDPKSVEALNEILHRTGALMVISSSWRCFWPLQELVEFLELAGVLPGRVVGRTPELEVERGLEIDAWLKAAPFPVASFVILDDMAMHRDRLVLTSFDNGLTLGHAYRSIEVLERVG
jgi:hypothetical protein